MPKHNRGRFFATVSAIFVAVLVALVLKTTWELAASNSRYSQEAEQSSKEYADRTHERIDSACAGMDPSTLAKCVDEIVKSTHEAQTTQRDLAAQRGMHTWAIAMFWATSASVFVTGVGVYYVALTLSEARATTDAAIRAANSSQAAVVEAVNATKSAREQVTLARLDSRRSHPPRFHVRQLYLDRNGITVGNVRDPKIIAEIFISNVGGYSAEIVNFSLALFLDGLPTARPFQETEPIMKKIVIKPGGMHWWKLGKGQVRISEDIWSVLAGAKGGTVYAVGRIAYQEVDSPENARNRVLFCRRYDPESRRFVVHEDHDYEYGT